MSARSSGTSVASTQELVRALACAGLVVGASASGCDRETPTQVMVNVDVQPTLAASARAIEVRVFDGAGAERGRQRIDVDADTPWPLRLPLVPEGGDASRMWLVEAAVRDDGDAIVALARSRGGYEAGVLRSTLLCVYDGCERTACGLVEATCNGGATCRTCEEGVCVEVPERASLVAGEGPLRCPRPMSDAAIDGARCLPIGPETNAERCSDGLDDDCDDFIDCLDPGCDGITCGGVDELCCDGACVASSTEGCGAP